MFESDSICLQVLSHWTRCEKGSWLCSYILKSPVCGTNWTLIRYVVFLHALFHDFSVHFMHGPWIGYFDIEICLSEGWFSRCFNPWLRCWLWSSRASFSTFLRPSPNNVEFQSLKLILGISISLVQTFEWGSFETTSIDSAKIVFRDAWLQTLKSWCWLLLWHVFLYILAWTVSLN